MIINIYVAHPTAKSDGTTFVVNHLRHPGPAGQDSEHDPR
jgi:hypothetical protein